MLYARTVTPMDEERFWRLVEQLEERLLVNQFATFADPEAPTQAEVNTLLGDIAQPTDTRNDLNRVFDMAYDNCFGVYLGGPA